jgi:hypothetical protein
MRFHSEIRVILPVLLFIAGGVQSPEEFFGHRARAENKLIHWDKIVEYLKTVFSL